MQRQHLIIFLHVLALSSVICRPQLIYFMLLLGFKNSKSLIKIFIQGKDVTVTSVLSWGMSLKKVNLSNHFVLLLKLLMSKENKLKQKHGHSHREKVGSLGQKGKRKWITFF